MEKRPFKLNPQPYLLLVIKYPDNFPNELRQTKSSTACFLILLDKEGSIGQMSIRKVPRCNDTSKAMQK